jgi:membrane protease YdiL (CAAX protease family)
MNDDRVLLSPASGDSRWVSRHALLAFFVSAFALSWWPLVLDIGGLVGEGIFPFGPTLAAILITGLTLGRTGMKALFSRLVRWRVEGRWYAVAFLLPVGLAAAAASLNVLLGASGPTAGELAGILTLPFVYVFRLVVGGALGEELGWRGFALPRMQAKRSALTASLMLGGIWASWHLPFYLSGAQTLAEFAPTFVVTFIATILITWLFNNTNGSVLLITLFHASNGTILAGFLSPMFSGTDAVVFGWLIAGMWLLAAIIVIIRYGPRDLSRKPLPIASPPGQEKAHDIPRS